MKISQTKLGILGGGQLGKMLLQSALDFDLEIFTLDPDPQAPCANFHSGFTQGNFNDFNTVYNFGKDKDLITIEIENVNTDALKMLQEKGVQIFPQPLIIEIIQDKGLQKEFLKMHNLPTAAFYEIENGSQLKPAELEAPKILKLRRGGYDGRGVLKVTSQHDQKDLFNAPCIVEDCIDIKKELAVIVARNQSGECRAYDPVEMIVNPEANLVDLLACPADISLELAERAKELAIQTAEALGIVGLLAVELFLDQKDQLLINELAPRPHNTGHHTIEACSTSQYQQLLRAILNLPLGSCELRAPAVMLNLLGAPEFEGPVDYQGLNEVLQIPDVYVHLYGKKITRPFRKMGHLTIVNKSRSQAIKIAQQIKSIIKVTA